MIWRKKNLEPHTVRELNRSLEIDALFSSIFMRRGLGRSDELLYFLEKNERYLHNPFLLNEMEDAAERMLSALDEGERVLIFGDRDVDGVSATVILYQGLLELGAQRENLQFRNPTAEDSYGLSLAVIEEAAANEVTLILTADCGCANHREIAAAGERGLDVIVLDHHMPREEHPAAYALVNPHSPGYPYRDICAASVCAKFLWALAYLKEWGSSKRFCLLDLGLVDGKLLARAARVQNLCVQSSLRLERKGPEDDRKLYDYIQNEMLCSFTARATRAALASIYGASSDIYLWDLCDELPSSLAARLRRTDALVQELQNLSRLARYRKLDSFDSQVELLISMLSRKMSLPHKILKQSLDLMAVATIADMMPLHNENRIIVALGLEEIRNRPRPGLRELLLELGLSGDIRELSWKVIPVLNAAGRMGNTALVTSLFTAPESQQRRQLARQLIQLNQERRQQSEKFLALAQKPARESLAESQRQLVYVAIAEIPRGLTGLLASRLSQQYGGVPAVVLAQDSGGGWSGSLRSGGEPSVLALLDPLADWFDNYGGHQAAGGFSLRSGEPKNLWRAFLALLPLSDDSRKNGGEEPGYDIDAEIPLEMLGPTLLERLWQPLSPYGVDWPELLLLSRGLLLQEAHPIGTQHLRLVFGRPETEGSELNAVFWRAAERYAKDFTKGDLVDILYHLQANYYQGQRRFQLEIVDIRPACRKP